MMVNHKCVERLYADAWLQVHRRRRKKVPVRYAATCPVCNARVQVESGGREFHGRLVGRCQESPDEHVFSFDRVTRAGKSLRSD